MFKSRKLYTSIWNILVKGTKVDNMYFLKVDNKRSIFDYLNVSIDSSFLSDLKLGHINKDKLIHMSKSKLLPKIIYENFSICESCIKGKHWKSLESLEGFHLDICGLLRTKTYKGMEDFVTFTYDYSRY